MSDSLDSPPEPLSLWEFCETLNELPAGEARVLFDPDDLLKQLQNDTDFLLPVIDVQVTSGDVEAKSPSKLHDEDKDILAELSTYRESSMTRSTSSESDVLTVSPVAPPLPLPVFTASTDTTRVIVNGGLIAQLPPMFRTKLDCPRDGGCSINTVKSLPGGSSCKGRDAIGSKHKFSCLCGLKWQENNWRERERLTSLGEEDTRCIQFLPITTTPKRKQSNCLVPKAKK